MKSLLRRLSGQKFWVYLAAFALMLLPGIPLFLAAQVSSTGWIILGLGCVVLGNLIVVFTR
jgi:hypothetical protein